jgi:hypothetical protein
MGHLENILLDANIYVYLTIKSAQYRLKKTIKNSWPFLENFRIHYLNN